MLKITRRLTVLALLTLLTGCGGGSGRAQFSVSGKVTFDGNPVSEGSVEFEDAGRGFGGSAPLVDGGTYSIELPEGSYKVQILPPMETTPDTPSSPGETKPKEVDNIPKTYRSYETSGFTADVASGKTTHDFEMKK